MARLKRFLSNPISSRLAAAPCIALCLCFSSAQAGKPLVQEEQDMIDTTFGEAPPLSVPSTTTAPLPEQVSTEPSPRPDQYALESTTPPEEDGVFENIVDPGETYQRNWNLDFQTNLGGSDWDTTTGTVWIGVSRRFENEVESFVPRAGWIRTSEDPNDFVSHIGIFGASIARSLFMDLAVGLDAEWKTQNGPDAWSAIADLAWEREISERIGVSAAVTSGWSSVSRTLYGASIEASAYPGSWIASVGISWNRRWQEYRFPLNQWRTEYVHAWGWSTSLHWTSGSWTTGPTWSGEYWKTSSRGIVSSMSYGSGRKQRYDNNRHSAPRFGTVSSEGVAVDQTLSWMVAWKPIESLRVKMDLSRSFGLSDATTRSTNARKIVPTSTVDAYLPADSWGGTFGISFDW